MEEKRIEAQRAKPRTSFLADDALMREEEQKRTKKETELVSNPPILDHSVSSYDPQGSYGEPILLTSRAHRRNIYIYIYIFIFFNYLLGKYLILPLRVGAWQR